jgi:hypothetical protein
LFKTPEVSRDMPLCLGAGSMFNEQVPGFTFPEGLRGRLSQVFRWPVDVEEVLVGNIWHECIGLTSLAPIFCRRSWTRTEAYVLGTGDALRRQTGHFLIIGQWPPMESKHYINILPLISTIGPSIRADLKKRTAC